MTLTVTTEQAKGLMAKKLATAPKAVRDQVAAVVLIEAPIDELDLHAVVK